MCTARPLRIAILFLSLLAWASAQTPEFEVATLRISSPPPGDAININLGTALNGTVTLTNATLADCIKFAYGLVADAQLSAPDWARTGANRFDVVAKAAPGTSHQDMLLMLQNLLTARLHLAVHKEPRDLHFLALIIDKPAPKLQPSAPDAVPANTPMLFGNIVNPKMSIPTLAKLLSRFERQTILDLTGLEGSFDIRLKWSPASDRPDAPLADGPSLYTALRQQLGLRLEPRKGPVDVLVVDHADRVPVEN